MSGKTVYHVPVFEIRFVDGQACAAMHDGEIRSGVESECGVRHVPRAAGAWSAVATSSAARSPVTSAPLTVPP
jgi:hypothetical protein